jgi:hypothetical protein
VKPVVLAKFLKDSENRKDASRLENDVNSRFYCSVCGREISEEEYESYDGMCEECYPVENMRAGLRRRRVLTANVAFLQQTGFTASASC